MYMRNILLVSLLAGLYGCQPETSPQQTTAPVEVMPSEPVSAAAAQADVVVKAASAVLPAVSAAAEGVAPAAKGVAPVKAASAKIEAAPTVIKAAAPVKEKVTVVVTPKVAAIAIAAPVAVVKTEVTVSEADALALAKKNNCLACHAIDKKVVGPAWKDVAAKYRGDATAEAHLVSKIATGGSGVWGSMAMPAHPKISEADRTTLAKFVLNLK